jgi:hypothetical protein
VEPSFDVTTFSKNRQRLLQHEVAQQFFDQVVVQADGLGLLPSDCLPNRATYEGGPRRVASPISVHSPYAEPFISGSPFLGVTIRRGSTHHRGDPHV